MTQKNVNWGREREEEKGGKKKEREREREKKGPKDRRSFAWKCVYVKWAPQLALVTKNWSDSANIDSGTGDSGGGDSGFGADNGASDNSDSSDRDTTPSRVMESSKIP